MGSLAGPGTLHTDLLDSWFFYAFGLLVLGGALCTVALRSPVHCAIGLMASLIGTAGLFLLQGAEFLFVAQIILYVGGILVLFLFVIMLVNLDLAENQRRLQSSWPVATLCLAVVAVELLWLGRAGLHLQFPAAVAAPVQGNTEQVGDMLLGGYLLPFEISSILLLVAMVGAIVMAKERRA